MDNLSDGIFDDSPSEKTFKYIYYGGNSWPKNDYQEIPISKREILLAKIAAFLFRTSYALSCFLTGMQLTEDEDGRKTIYSKDGDILEGYDLNHMEVSKRWERIE